MRGSKALITTDDVNYNLNKNACFIKSIYACLSNMDKQCFIDKKVYNKCVENLKKYNDKKYS